MKLTWHCFCPSMLLTLCAGSCYEALINVGPTHVLFVPCRSLSDADAGLGPADLYPLYYLRRVCLLFLVTT